MNDHRQVINPLVESIAERVHDIWMATKHRQLVTSRLSETGEELMVPYGELSEAAKDLDRNSVQVVLDALGVVPQYAVELPKGRDKMSDDWVAPLPSLAVAKSINAAHDNDGTIWMRWFFTSPWAEVKETE